MSNHVPFNAKLYALPTTTLILGSHFDGKPNFMALAWATRVNFQPPLIAIGVNNTHRSHQAITATGEFSLSMPSVEMVAITDYVGLVSARTTDKSSLFTLFYGSLQAAPMVRECPLTLELRLHTTVDLPSNTVFIGEIVGAWCKEDALRDGVPEVSAIKPFILTMPDNRYWALGEQVGQAWHSGKDLKKKENIS